MEKQIEVPSFVNENYYKAKNEANDKQKQEYIKNMKVYKNTYNKFKLACGIAATTVVVLATIPRALEVVDVCIEKFVEWDNEKFEKECEYIEQQVYEQTGQTTEEIMNSHGNR